VGSFLSLSCKSREVSLFSDFAKNEEPKFEDQNLFKQNFIIPGKGEKPLYCDKSYVNGFNKDLSGLHSVNTKCGKMSCPACSQLWVLQWIFKIAVMIEAYSIFSGSRPAQGEASVDYNRTFNLKQIRNLNSQVNVKLKKCGVTAGVKMFHAFRFTANAREALKFLTKSENSSKFWKYLRVDDNIVKLNEYLGTDFKDYHGFVNLAPHWHFLFFPGTQLLSGSKKFLLRKNFFKKRVNGKMRKTYTLDSAEAVIKFVSYLITHTTSLEDGHNAFIHPIPPFLGEMNRKNPSAFVSPDVLIEIERTVLEILNNGRDRLLELDNKGSVKWASPLIEDKEIIPITNFRLYSLDSHQYVQDFVLSVQGSVKYSANSDYFEYLIDLYNQVQDSKEIPLKWKKLFIAPFDILPPFVQSMASYNPVRLMFEYGLKAPPSTFEFHHAGNEIKNYSEPEYIPVSDTKFIHNGPVPVIIKDIVVNIAYVLSMEKRLKDFDK